MPGLRREAISRGGGTVVGVRAALTSVRGRGRGRTVGVGVDASAGVALTGDGLPPAAAATLATWVGDLAAALGAAVLVSAAATDGSLAALGGPPRRAVAAAKALRQCMDERPPTPAA